MKIQMKLGVKLIFQIFIVMCFLTILSLDSIFNENIIRENKAGIIRLSGNSYEIGYQRAVLNLDGVHNFKGSARKVFRGPNTTALQLAYQFHLTEIQEKFPGLIKEWRGIADGAKIPFEDVAVNKIGVRTIKHSAGLPANTEQDPNDHFEACSVFAMVTSDRGPIVGNTGDSHSSPRNPNVYYIEKETDSGQYRVIRCKGAGFNEMGLAIGSGNAHYRGRDNSPMGPASELSKVVLRYCPDVDSAVNFIRKYKISDDGNHYAMADISGKAAAVEKGPEGLFIVRWADSTGFAFVTNTSPDSFMRAQCTSAPDYFTNSDNRYANLLSLFSDPNFAFTFAAAESVIFNHDSLGAICQHGDRYAGQWYTTRTRMMLPLEGKMLLAAKTSDDQQIWKPCECGWIEDTLSVVATGVKYQITALPERCRLEQNYPNPFNAHTKIVYELIENGQVEVTIFNLLGENVKILTNEFQSKGEHSVDWDGKDEFGHEVASGTYYYQLKANNITLTKRMTLIK